MVQIGSKSNVALQVTLAALMMGVFIWMGSTIQCSGTGPPVLYILPDNFRGQIKLVVDAEAPEVPLLDGNYVVRVPREGLVKVKSTDFLFQWHEVRARFKSGKALSIDSENRNQLSLISMGQESSNVADEHGYKDWHLYCVGTHDECYK